MTKCVVIDTSSSPFAKLKPVPISAVKLVDDFWAPRLKTLREVTIPSQYEQFEKTGRLENFRKVARGEQDITWHIADDSDVYKWVEAASYALAYEHDERVEELLNDVVDAIASAQDEDGYLFTYYAFNKEARWRNLRDMHELYCAGHLFQAAVAHHRATGSHKLLEVAVRFADHICRVFGPGKRKGVPGHPEIEMALVELYRETRRKEYLELAKFFIDERGKGLIGGSPYHIDHKPFRELTEMVGHAVRAVYLNCGATDVYLETGDETLWSTLTRLWENMVQKKMYITGGIGSRYAGEAFGEDYELPDVRAYAETCAAIASIMWNFRMLLATGDAKYADILELTLYNGALSGISLNGKEYFYVNPLADRGKIRRKEWYYCACCPPNIARLLASVPGYFYSTSKEGIWVHLYAANRATIDFNENRVRLEVYTKYPWDGGIEIVVNPEKEKEFSLFVRIPGWCEKAQLSLNGRPLREEVSSGTYVEIRRIWRKGDRVKLELEMPVKLVVAHPHVLCYAGRVAVKRGPLVYCFEHEDNPRIDVWDIVLTEETQLAPVFEPELLGGVVVLKGKAYVMESENWRLALHAYLEKAPVAYREVEVTAIPYYAWANRKPGPMIVWVRYQRSEEVKAAERFSQRQMAH